MNEGPRPREQQIAYRQQVTEGFAVINYLPFVFPSGGWEFDPEITGQIKNTAVLDSVNGRAVGRYHGWICFNQQNQQ